MNKIKNSKIIDYLSWSVIFLIPLLITGPLLPEIVMNISIIVFLHHLVMKKKIDYLKNTYTYLFLTFFVYININSLINFNLVSLKSSALYFRFYLLTMLVVYCLENNKFFINRFFKTLIITILILIIDGTIQYFFGKNILGWEKIVHFRVSSFFGDEMIFGSYLFRVAPFLMVSYYFIQNNRPNNSGFFLILAILFLGISISGERTAFFLFVIFLTLLIPLIINFLKKIKFIHIFSAGFLLILIFSTDSFNRNIKTTINSILVSDGEKINKIRLFSYVHESHYKTAFKIFENNKVFGIGIKQFREKCKKPEYIIDKHSCSTHPHNYYMQFLSEIGLIGLLFLSAVFLTSLFYLLLILKKKIISRKYLGEFYILNCGIFTTLFPLAPSGNFFNNWLSFFLFFLFGFFIYLNKKIKF